MSIDIVNVDAGEEKLVKDRGTEILLLKLIPNKIRKVTKYFKTST